MAYKARNNAPRVHGVSRTTVVTGQPPRLLVGNNAHADSSTAAHARAMQTARATMERYNAADRLRNAISHPGTTVTDVDVGQKVWLHRQKGGSLRGIVHAPDGKTVSIRRDGSFFSSHEARTKPYVDRSTPRRPPADPPPATHPAPIRTHTRTPTLPNQVPAAARVFTTHRVDPLSHHHPR